MTKKKVLIVGPAYPLRGGLATYDERLCREFIALGHACEILSFSLQYPSFLFPGKTQYSTDPPPEGISIHPDINSVNPVNWITLGKRLARKKYDLVIFRYWMSFMAPAFGTIARLIKKNGHTRVIAITDNIYPHEKRFFDTAFTGYFLNACDGFLSMSEAVAQQARALQPGKPAAYVPHPMYDMFGPATGKEDAREKLGLEANGRYLLFFGFIRKYKGLGLLLESMTDERIKKLNIKLIVAGEFYEDRKPYDDLIAAHNLAGSLVLRTDFIPNSEVSNYFNAADMVVQTYLNATQSGVTQIAYFYDKPMLVTDVGGLAELVPDRKVGYVVKPDARMIADAIIDFYTAQRAQGFIDQIRVEKEKFTWHYLAGKLIALSEQ